jgi:hypothetical protein
VKKVLLLVSALLIVFSGVAAVSAYEGHLVNVKAHVENAIGVTDYEVDFGIVFPEEKVETEIYVGLSESFKAQDRYSTVEYMIYWEPKPIPADADPYPCDPDDDGYYAPIWEYLITEVGGVELDNDLFNEVDPGLYQYPTIFRLNLGEPCDQIHFIIDPPVFDKWYNEMTDPRIPSGILEEGEYCVVEELICDELVDVPHADLGSDLKIQVVDIIVD